MNPSLIPLDQQWDFLLSPPLEENKWQDRQKMINHSSSLNKGKHYQNCLFEKNDLSKFYITSGDKR